MPEGRWYQEGYAAGLKSPRGIDCPYDGRTKAGREWWLGFMAGDAERCTSKVIAAQARAPEAAE